jgi:hypothetical protein
MHAQSLSKLSREPEEIEPVAAVLRGHQEDVLTKVSPQHTQNILLVSSENCSHGIHFFQLS